MAKPRFSCDDAATIASEHFGIQSTSISSLPSYDDQNFRVHSAKEDVVLKIAASGSECRDFAGAEETQGQLEFENALMRLLADEGVTVPCLFKSKDDQDLIRHAGDNGGDGVNYVRAISFLPGEVFAKVEHTDAVLRRFGHCLGRMDKAMSTFDSPHAHRTLTWDLAQAPKVREMLNDVEEEANRALADRMLGHFEAAEAVFSVLPKQVVHGDANDYNVLVSADAFHVPDGIECSGIGILDFGDAVYTQRVCNLAVALAYVCQNKESGEAALQAAMKVTQGYLKANDFCPEELAVLFKCICARLVQSVVMSARSVKNEPENAEYLMVNAKPAWALLWQWADLDMEVTCKAFSSLN